MQRIVFFYLIVLLFAPLKTWGQQEEVLGKKEQKSLAREERKAIKASEDEKKKILAKWMIDNQKFVMEADYVSDSRGNRKPVLSTLNFISIDSAKAVIQLSIVSGPGYNGVGGITVEGMITKYKVDTNITKSGTSYNISVILQSTTGNYDIFFSISSTGFADAMISGTTRGSLRYTGTLVPIDVSRVYKGSTSY
jgi:hypothetical protein